MSPLYREIRHLENLVAGMGPELLPTLEEIVESALRWSGADRASLIHIGPSQEVLHFVRGGSGWADVVTTISFHELEAGLSGWALNTGEVAVSPGGTPDPRESPDVQRRRRETNCGAVLVAPLGSAGQSIGTISLINRPDQPDFTPQNAEDLAVFAYFAAWIIRAAEGRIHTKAAQAEARTALNSKTQFLSNLSHELRTPLNGVLGFSHLLASSALEDGQKNMVDTILQSGHRLLATVDNLLELAQFETGQFRLESSPFSPRAVLEAVVAKHQEPAAEKNLLWAVTSANDLPPVLEGDAVRLGQAWNHVLSNAVKFTTQGKITVHLESRRSPRGRTELILNVHDTGIGLSNEKSGLWFMPFHQEDGSLTRKFGGTGLGLALCDRIVRRMGGGLSLMGEPGVGTKVRIWVDLSHDHPEVRPGLRVLVQGDDPVTGLVIVKLLEHAGHRADFVSRADQIRDRLKTSDYDLLLAQAPSDAGLIDELRATRPALALVGLYNLGSSPTPKETASWTTTLHTPVTQQTLVAALNRCQFEELR